VCKPLGEVPYVGEWEVAVRGAGGTMWMISAGSGERRGVAS